MGVRIPRILLLDTVLADYYIPGAKNGVTSWLRQCFGAGSGFETHNDADLGIVCTSFNFGSSGIT